MLGLCWDFVGTLPPYPPMGEGKRLEDDASAYWLEARRKEEGETRNNAKRAK